MTSAPEVRNFRGHTWLEASLACSSATLRALVSAAVTTALCAFRDCDRRSTSDSNDVTWNSRPLTLWNEGRVRENAQQLETVQLPIRLVITGLQRLDLGTQEFLGDA